MNFQHIRAFCTVVNEGSFSRAAEKLQLTQPTISAQIQGLETTLHARLFERSAQGIALTAAGRTLLPYARQMLELDERTTQAMEQLGGLAWGELLLGASSVPGHYVLPRAVTLFKQAHPGIKVHLSVSNSQEVRTGIRDGRHELGMVGEQVRDERLAFEPLVRDRLLVVMRPEHPLANRESLTVEELAAQPLVVREHGSATQATVDRALSEAGVTGARLQIYLELGSAEAVKQAIRAADLCAVLSEWSVRDEVRLGLLHASTLQGVDLRRDLYLVWRAHGYLSVASEAFVRFLREEHLAAEGIEPGNDSPALPQNPG
jgi:DNA-binding transcriptional LysR family regulator